MAQRATETDHFFIKIEMIMMTNLLNHAQLYQNVVSVRSRTVGRNRKRGEVNAVS